MKEIDHGSFASSVDAVHEPNFDKAAHKLVEQVSSVMV